MDVKVLQYIMGHANIAVTMEVYNHITEHERIEKNYKNRRPDGNVMADAPCTSKAKLSRSRLSPYRLIFPYSHL